MPGRLSRRHARYFTHQHFSRSALHATVGRLISTFSWAKATYTPARKRTVKLSAHERAQEMGDKGKKDKEKKLKLQAKKKDQKAKAKNDKSYLEERELLVL